MLRKEKFFFILGGPDREMAEIKKVLFQNNLPFSQPYKNWKEREIKRKKLKELNADYKRVYVECFPEKNLRKKDDILIDHHGKSSYKRSSLIQVKKLLKLPTTKKDLLLEGWDRGGVRGFLKAGGEKRKALLWLKEIYTKKDFEDAIKALKQAFWQGKTLVVRQKNPASLLTGNLLGLKFYPKIIPLLVIVEKEKPIEYDYTGYPKIAKKLWQKFGGWLGGNPKDTMYWGLDKNLSKLEEVLEEIK